MESVAKIRRCVLADGMSIREVSRRTGFSRNTVRKYLRDENVEPRYRLKSPRQGRRLLEHDQQCAARERRSMRGLFEALDIQGFEGSYDTVRRYIVRLKSKAGP